jgi:hypothetical protein
VPKSPKITSNTLAQDNELLIKFPCLPGEPRAERREMCGNLCAEHNFMIHEAILKQFRRESWEQASETGDGLEVMSMVGLSFMMWKEDLEIQFEEESN